MAALLGWIALALQLGSDVPMAVDVPAVAVILNSYILFLAAGQRAGVGRGRYILGAICLVACLSVFFANPRAMFGVQAASGAIFFAGTGLLCGWRCWRKANTGDAIIATAALMILAGIAAALYWWLRLGDFPFAQAIMFGVYSAAYALVVIGFLASLVVEYQQNLSNLALEDPLTRLLNRRGLENALHITLAQASRQHSPTAAVMVDIDHFKVVNDNFGHEAGDQVIRQIAKVLKRLSRSGDVVARTGGEEFLLVLPGTELDGARVMAERIRADISERPLVVNQQRIAITVSVGVAGTIGAIELDKLSQDADRAMHLAKRGGRNRVASVENKPVYLSTQSNAP
jgi:diguanylate cyclase (GGDEF)-like protein